MRTLHFSILLLAALQLCPWSDAKFAAQGNINVAQVGSSTFAVVDSYACDDEVMKTIKTVSTVNRGVFDACKDDSGYQLYPYTGFVPDEIIVTKLVDSPSCMGIITSVVLLNMPPCTIDTLPMRATCETLLYFSTVMGNEASPPTAAQFSELMTWRRDSDLAKAAGAPFDGDSTTYNVFTKNLRAALIASKVTVLHNYTIVLEDSEGTSIEMSDGKHPSFTSTDSNSNSSVDFFVGKVQAAGAESASASASDTDNTNTKDTTSDDTAAELVTTRTSGAPTSVFTFTAFATTLAMAATCIY